MNRFSDLGPWWLTAAIGLLDLFAIARALVRGHGVTSTLAWICGVIAFPGVGALAYLLLANPSVRRTVRRRAAASICVDSAGLVEHLVAPDERRLATLANAPAVARDSPLRLASLPNIEAPKSSRPITDEIQRTSVMAYERRSIELG